MNRTILRNILVLGCIALMAGCASNNQFSPGKGNKYIYSYKLAYPTENADLFFQDDSIIIQFKFDEAALRFQLQNISESHLQINWSKAAMSVSGNYMAIRHSDNWYSDSARARSFALPPLGYIRDQIIPRDNISNDGDRWIEEDLLPTTDRNSQDLREAIQKNLGKRISCILPVIFGSSERMYEFDFQVETVKRIPWKEYTPYKRLPVPPNPKHTVLGLDNVTTAIIAVGVLGFSAYIISLKKNPPSE
jgi:hypothetical protein